MQMTIGTTALRHPVGVSWELTEELRRRVVAETAIRVVPADGFVCGVAAQVRAKAL